MLFPDDTLFEHALLELSEVLTSEPIAPIHPLPCDRWIARSALQKACRRGKKEIAQRALANVFEYDRRAAWRAITIIALEDVGVANVDALAWIIAAQRDRTWRQKVGGDWTVMVGIVGQLAASDHCQAACDLLLQAQNDTRWEHRRAAALEVEPGLLARTLRNSSAAIEDRAIAALAMGSGLADGQSINDPCAVFDILGEGSRSTHVIATCRAAWKLSRNPMAFLLPLVWERRIEDGDHRIEDDTAPAVQMIDGVPGYALGQFTRRGKAVIRALLTEAPELRSLFEAADIHPTEWGATTGDLIFLWEGSAVRRRAIWGWGDDLRQPHRCLPATARLGSNLDPALRLIEVKASQIENLRRRHLTTHTG